MPLTHHRRLWREAPKEQGKMGGGEIPLTVTTHNVHEYVFKCSHEIHQCFVYLQSVNIGVCQS